VRLAARLIATMAVVLVTMPALYADTEAETPKIEWSVGYSFWRAMPTATSNRMGYLHGGSTSAAYNFTRHLGLVADFGGYANSRTTLMTPSGDQTFDSNGTAYTYMLGPRYSFRGERFTPFVQALFGGAHADSVTLSGCSGVGCVPLGAENAFAAMAGVGFDIKINRRFALRPFEGDFLMTHFKNPFSPQLGWQKNARFSAGLVVRFGEKVAPLPSASIAATCSADQEMVYAGSDDLVAVRARTSNPDSLPLNYHWSASEGDVDGTGPAVRWNSSSRRPGTYTIKVRVDNGRNSTADCSANIRVEARPNRPPTLSCSANRRDVTAGEPVEITAIASDPDDDPLSFSWNTSARKVEGSGSSVTFRTADLTAGSYAITGHVNDGRGGTADCLVSVNVQEPQPPPEIKELEQRLALHSIYFPTGRPTLTNPAADFVESQQGILRSLASDFNRYLASKPQSHLILEGHADRRGSIEYNNALTERRVARTMRFLIEHGVPAANIETRSLGKQENLDAEQVKRLIEQNPDLNNRERQELESNLQTIVWANNRRVDISLNTTGQESTRLYPFNAKDSMTLLSDKGSESKTRTSPPATLKKISKR
jgi:outer membrane protein OmpA-like peptidoglycan-associated protein